MYIGSQRFHAYGVVDAYGGPFFAESSLVPVLKCLTRWR